MKGLHMQEQTNTGREYLDEDDRPLTEEDMAGFTNNQLIMIFIEGLIEEKGLTGNDRLRADLKRRFDLFYGMKLAQQLSAEEKERIQEASRFDALNSSVLTQILEDSGVDTENIIQKAMDGFRMQYLQEGVQNA